jgi:hypothetical protein
MIRVVPEAALGFGPEIVWHDYRSMLAPSAVTELGVVEPLAYCLFGNSMEVPR